MGLTWHILWMQQAPRRDASTPESSQWPLSKEVTQPGRSRATSRTGNWYSRLAMMSRMSCSVMSMQFTGSTGMEYFSPSRAASSRASGRSGSTQLRSIT